MAAKLYFRYGTVCSAKTLNLLAVSHSYNSQNKKCIIIKPKIDDRFGKNAVGSRAGLSKSADILIDNGDDIQKKINDENIYCILVDEAQFFTADHIDQLRNITIEKNIPVIAYGLRTDFTINLFEGSKRLFEVADCIEEIKNVCMSCNRKAIVNARILNEELVLCGDQICISSALFKPMCYKCFIEKRNARNVKTFAKQIKEHIESYS
ncbi:MAG: thymidine kinase [Chlamydiia bacterium]|nr:thymidine kinase [Chlamydiia bacterium]